MNQQNFLFQTPKLALTRVEAADALDISPATLDRLTQRGLLRPCRALRRPLYSVEELKRFLAETGAGLESDSQRPDRSGEVFHHLRESEPRRQNEYDELRPLGASHGR